MYASTSFTDKNIECADCGQEFVHSAQDQQFYAERQFSDPREPELSIETTEGHRPSSSAADRLMVRDCRGRFVVTDVQLER